MKLYNSIGVNVSADRQPDATQCQQGFQRAKINYAKQARGFRIGLFCQFHFWSNRHDCRFMNFYQTSTLPVRVFSGMEVCRLVLTGTRVRKTLGRRAWVGPWLPFSQSNCLLFILYSLWVCHFVLTFLYNFIYSLPPLPTFYHFLTPFLYFDTDYFDILTIPFTIW